MRRLVICGVALLACFLTPTEASAESHCRDTFGGRVRCDLREDSRSAPPTRSSSPRPTVPLEDRVYWPRVVTRDGVQCLVFDREVFEGAASSRAAFEAEMRTLRLMATYDFCPGVTRPRLSPTSTARQVIEEFEPAPPRPYIAPGYAITGKAAYLETRGNLHPPRQTRSTALGSIDVTFSGRYTVDWGDGTVETYDVEGGPWPDGRVTHTYTDVGRYDVVVTVDWVADWEVAGATGRIDDGLSGVGRIDDFEVRQLQAVRDR